MRVLSSHDACVRAWIRQPLGASGGSVACRRRCSGAGACASLFAGGLGRIGSLGQATLGTAAAGVFSGGHASRRPVASKRTKPRCPAGTGRAARTPTAPQPVSAPGHRPPGSRGAAGAAVAAAPQPRVIERRVTAILRRRPAGRWRRPVRRCRRCGSGGGGTSGGAAGRQPVTPPPAQPAPAGFQSGPSTSVVPGPGAGTRPDSRPARDAARSSAASAVTIPGRVAQFVRHAQHAVAQALSQVQGGDAQGQGGDGRGQVGGDHGNGLGQAIHQIARPVRRRPAPPPGLAVGHTIHQVATSPCRRRRPSNRRRQPSRRRPQPSSRCRPIRTDIPNIHTARTLGRDRGARRAVRPSLIARGLTAACAAVSGRLRGEGGGNVDRAQRRHPEPGPASRRGLRQRLAAV